MDERSVAHGPTRSDRRAIRVALVTIGLGCLWIGWGDFDLWPAQEEVRVSIRASIRWTIQTLVQYVVPVAIAAYLARGLLGAERRDD